MMATCPRCDKETELVRKVDWLWLGLALLLCVDLFLAWRSNLIASIPIVVFGFYHFTKVPKTCPLCGYGNVFDAGKELERKRISQLRKANHEPISRLKNELLDLDKKIRSANRKGIKPDNNLLLEFSQVSEELQKYGYEGRIEKRPFVTITYLHAFGKVLYRGIRNNCHLGFITVVGLQHIDYFRPAIGYRHHVWRP